MSTTTSPYPPLETFDIEAFPTHARINVAHALCFEGVTVTAKNLDDPTADPIVLDNAFWGDCVWRIPLSLNGLTPETNYSVTALTKNRDRQPQASTTAVIATPAGEDLPVIGPVTITGPSGCYNGDPYGIQYTPTYEMSNADRAEAIINGAAPRPISTSTFTVSPNPQAITRWCEREAIETLTLVAWKGDASVSVDVDVPQN